MKNLVFALITSVCFIQTVHAENSSISYTMPETGNYACYAVTRSSEAAAINLERLLKEQLKCTNINLKTSFQKTTHIGILFSAGFEITGSADCPNNYLITGTHSKPYGCYGITRKIEVKVMNKIGEVKTLTQN